MSNSSNSATQAIGTPVVEDDVGSEPADRIRIFDTTLRDGEQSPGCSLRPRQKLTLAHALAELGVDVIEAGFAASSEADAEGIRTIAREVREVSICSLARCHAGDIEAAVRSLEPAAKPRLHVFISTSPLHREHKLGLDRGQVLARAVEGVTLARRHVADVEFSAEDALRTEPEFLVEIFSAAIAAGASTINVPDTVGYTTPAEIRALFEYLRKNVRGAERAVFSSHCHNDLGLAVANSLAAVEGGARQVECTINGIGERAGNCALEELVMALKVRHAWFNVDTGIDTTRLVPTSRLLARSTGMAVQPNKAIVGANAFAHEAGIHQHGMLKHRGTYEIMHPESVGWVKSHLILGRHSGRHAINDRMKELGFALDDVGIERVFAAFKALAEKKREVFDADLEAIALGAESGASRGWQLVRWTVHTGTAQGSMPTASVELASPDGSAVCEAAVGDGPVHALCHALSRATGLALELDSYNVQSVTTGEDAQGQATLLAHYQGEEFNGNGTSTDILEATAMAWLDMANRCLRASNARRITATEPVPDAQASVAA
ncbi:MAG: 2-isopropylmalate synthase [Pseudomonadota bacterium]|nr:2-isopropylmalate synthase [Pseudomonadota bacterium]